MAEQEMFPATNGLATGIGGLVVAAVAAVLGLTWVDYRYAPVLLSIALLLAVLTYAVVLRPRVGIDGDDLVLRQVFSTTRIPLAAVQEVELRRIAVFHVGGRRYDSPALSRTRPLSRRLRRLDERLDMDSDEPADRVPTASEAILQQLVGAMAAAQTPRAARRAISSPAEWTTIASRLSSPKDARPRSRWRWPTTCAPVGPGRSWP